MLTATAQPKIKNKIFFPNLDGLRFFCFISVFLYHSFATNIQYISNDPIYRAVKYGLFGNGFLGVNFFFVLSGFLITYLLLKEKLKYGKIHVGSFYIRRILRIWPLFYLSVAFGFLIFPILKSHFGETPNEHANVLAYIFLVNNFDFIHTQPDASNLSVLWSVAIEEQFYLVWPLIIALIPTKYLNRVFLSIITASLIFRVINSGNENVLNFHTLSCISDMTIGGLAAYYIISNSSFRQKIEGLNKWVIVCVYVAIAVIFLTRQIVFSLIPSLERLVISILFALVILEQCYSKNSFYKMGRLTNVSQLGKYTYGLYCLHMIGILAGHTILTKFGLNNTTVKLIFTEGALTLLITLVLAFVSYHLMEKRFLKLKEKFAFIKT